MCRIHELRCYSQQRQAFLTNNIISLFSGVGGLDLGFEAAGFSIAVAVENDPHCIAILNKNSPHWRTANPGDIGSISSRALLRQGGLKNREAAVLIGGPPCQPFSKSRLWVNGSAPGLDDSRSSTIDEYFRVLNDTLPRAVVLENVSGLATAKRNSAVSRIEKFFREINLSNKTNYRPVILNLNAADYGVPQSRRRLFIIAERSGLEFRMPPPSHATTHSGTESAIDLQPPTTAWDAIGDLDKPTHDPELELTGKWADLIPSIPEGKNYLWHTDRGGGVPIFGWRTRYWSFLLKLSKRQPSWTLQATPGPATGPFHWRNRRLSVREMARIQTFPDSYKFNGSYREATRQIGNAVPPALSEVLARELMRQFFDNNMTTPIKFQISRKTEAPRRHPVQPVPEQFLTTATDCSAHPGVGKGPRARSDWSK